jgi:hypothetical protein
MAVKPIAPTEAVRTADLRAIDGARVERRCSPLEQASCCEPAAKPECCAPPNTEGCGRR